MTERCAWRPSRWAPAPVPWLAGWLALHLSESNNTNRTIRCAWRPSRWARRGLRPLPSPELGQNAHPAWRAFASATRSVAGFPWVNQSWRLCFCSTGPQLCGVPGRAGSLPAPQRTVSLCQSSLHPPYAGPRLCPWAHGLKGVPGRAGSLPAPQCTLSLCQSSLHPFCAGPRLRGVSGDAGGDSGADGRPRRRRAIRADLQVPGGWVPPPRAAEHALLQWSALAWVV